MNLSDYKIEISLSKELEELIQELRNDIAALLEAIHPNNDDLQAQPFD